MVVGRLGRDDPDDSPMILFRDIRQEFTSIDSPLMFYALRNRGEFHQEDVLINVTGVITA